MFLYSLPFLLLASPLTAEAKATRKLTKGAKASKSSKGVKFHQLKPLGYQDLAGGCSGTEQDVLQQLSENDGFSSPNWMVCSCPSYLGGSPAQITYTTPALPIASLELKVEVTDSSGEGSVVDVTCDPTGAFAGDGNELFLTYEGSNADAWLAPIGEFTLGVPLECITSDGSGTITMQWRRTNSRCLKFDYMLLDVHLL